MIPPHLRRIGLLHPLWGVALPLSWGLLSMLGLSTHLKRGAETQRQSPKQSRIKNVSTTKTNNKMWDLANSTEMVQYTSRWYYQVSCSKYGISKMTVSNYCVLETTLFCFSSLNRYYLHCKLLLLFSLHLLLKFGFVKVSCLNQPLYYWAHILDSTTTLVS